jgi:hypothetical protein
MKMSFLPAISLGLAGCATATTDPTSPGATGRAARDQIEQQWGKVMQDLDEACIDTNKRLLRQPVGGLNAVAASPQKTADRISLGHGALDYKQVNGFASMSHDCEAWPLQIAIEAKNGHRMIAADLYGNVRKQHCARGYDADGASQ